MITANADWSRVIATRLTPDAARSPPATSAPGGPGR
jgi:hypothetical protein